MKYLIVIITICVLGVGCAIVPPSATTVSTNEKTFYIVKSGTTKGGSPVGVVIAIENDGQMMALGSFNGRSTTEQIVGGVAQIPSAVVNGVGAGYLIGRGLRHNGNTQMQGQVIQQ